MNQGRSRAVRFVVAGLASMAVCLGSAPGLGQEGEAIRRTPAPPDAKVYIISPKDGEVVQSPFKVLFGLSGMGVAPAGVDYPGAGHHHLLVDAEPPDPTQPIPSDENHRHYGRGQTEVMLSLESGEHTLQLMLGDRDHVPHEPPVQSDVIHIRVE